MFSVWLDANEVAVKEAYALYLEGQMWGDDLPLEYLAFARKCFENEKLRQASSITV